MVHRSAPTYYRVALPMLALLAVLGVAYVKVLQFGIIPAWDDGQYVVNRTEVVAWAAANWRDRLLTPSIGYPIPVPTALYATLHTVFGEPAYFAAVHAASLLLHLANTVLAFLLARRWLGLGSAAIGVAAIWGLHPVAVETVAWATNVKTVLYGFFMLAAMLTWEHVVNAPDRARLKRIGVVALFALAMGCRPEASILPGLLAVQSIRTMDFRDAIARHGLFLGVMATIGVAALLAAQMSHADAVVQSELLSRTLCGRLLLVFTSIGTSCINFVIPFNLQPAYSVEANPSLVGALPGVTVVIGWCVGLCLALRRRSAPMVFFVVIPAVLYFPYAQVVELPRMAADTYSYLPGFAVLVGLASGLTRLPTSWHKPALAVSAGLVLGATVLTWQQVDRWESGVTLWEPMILEEPTTARPYRQTAFAYWQLGDTPAAIEILERGWPAFRLQRSFPFWAPLVFEDAGRAIEAANKATDAWLNDRSPSAQHAKVLIEILARNDVPLPESPDVRNALHESTALYITRADWLQERDADLAIGHYLVRQRANKLAIPFIKAALNRESVRCDAWTVIQSSQRREDFERFFGAAVPAGCGD